MNFLVLDIETTGLESSKNSIVSISAKLIGDNKEMISCFNTSCFDQNSITNLGALAVNRFKFSKLNALEDEKTSLLNLCDWILSLPKGELCLVGHNVHFDIEFIKKRLSVYNIEGFDQLISYRIIDTAGIGRFLILTGLLTSQKASLKELAISLGIEYDSSKHHSADYDVDLTIEVLFRMIDLIGKTKNG